MTKIKATIVGLTCAITIVGCGEKGSSTPTVDSAPPAQNANPPASVSLTADAGTPSTAKPLVQAPVVMDLNTADRPLDARGNPMSDVEMLNLVIESYRMGAGATSADMATTGGRKPQGPAEEAAAFAAASTPKTAINDINDLVKLGLIKAIPPAPAGKQYAYENGAVVLKDKK